MSPKINNSPCETNHQLPTSKTRKKKPFKSELTIISSKCHTLKVVQVTKDTKFNIKNINFSIKLFNNNNLYFYKMDKYEIKNFIKFLK